MKKILFFISLFLLNINTVLAITTDRYITCTYRQANEYITIHYDASSYQSADTPYIPRKAEHYYEVNDGKDVIYDDFFESGKSKNYIYGNYDDNTILQNSMKLALIGELAVAPYGSGNMEYYEAIEKASQITEKYFYSTKNVYNQNYDELYLFNSESKKAELISPKKIFIAEHKNNSYVYGCGDNKIEYVSEQNGGYEIFYEKESTCSYMEKAINYHVTNNISKDVIIKSFDFYMCSELNVESYDDEKEVIAEAAAEWKEKIDKYCSLEKEDGSVNSDYDEEECRKAKIGYNSVVDDAEEYGIDEDEIETLIDKLKMDFDTSKGCVSYLGNPKIKGHPAYYLQFIFNLMKYAAIILLFVFTIVDFSKAVTSDKDDAIKKASSNAVKRLIIVIIIFFLPMLIEFILKLLGIYSASTCDIR